MAQENRVYFSRQAWQLGVFDLLKERPDEVYVGTFQVYLWKVSSPLHYIIHRLRDFPTQFLVGVSSADDILRTNIVASFYKGKINWRYRIAFHSKYFLCRYGKRWRGIAGSANFTDSTWDDTAVDLSTTQAKLFASYHDRYWKHAVASELAAQNIKESFTKLAAGVFFSPNDTGR